jgi:hypothetical protein
VRTFLRARWFAICVVLALVTGLSATIGAAPQAPQQPDSVAGASLDRIKGKLANGPARELKPDAPVPLRVPTFKARVDQRVFVMTLEEALHKEFDLNDLQRQSAEWASKCCGVDIGQLVKIVDDAMKERQVRKTREQIWRELAELEAARKKVPPPDVK